MNLYLISQSINNDYDTYDLAAVAAENEQDARRIHPSEFVTHVSNEKWMGTYSEFAGEKAGREYETENDASSSWVGYSDINRVNVEYLGTTNRERGVVCASFNTG